MTSPSAAGHDKLQPPPPSAPQSPAGPSALLEDYISRLSPSKLNLARQDRNLIGDVLATLSSQSSTRERILPLSSLLTTSTPTHFHVGTGLSATALLCSHIVRARREVLFVTCFWAASASLSLLRAALHELNRRHLARRADDGGGGRDKKLKVRICFSSSGPFHKLFHTSSPLGKIHDAPEALGLPPVAELPGLDVRVKSLFYTPLSVLHGKFLVVDGRTLVVPSANVSWEKWGECATVFEGGGIVGVFVAFWRNVWGVGEFEEEEEEEEEEEREVEEGEDAADEFSNDKVDGGGEDCYPTLFLPQPHHRNPRFFSFSFSPFSFSSSPSPPPTPQNTFFLSALAASTSRIYLHSPNLTSKPLVAALAAATHRNVAVTVVTCRRMMTLEQLVTTPFTYTERCVRALVKDAKVGFLKLCYYKPPGVSAGGGGGEGGEEGVDKWHVKACVIDDRVAVLGSANADRASWWTSQEVNVAVFSERFAGCVKQRLEEGVRGRLESVCGGDDDTAAGALDAGDIV